MLATYTGAQLVGTRYTPPFDFFRTRPTSEPNRFSPSQRVSVLTADYVTTEDGTGVVHIAPAFGEEDKAVTDAAGIEVVNPVDGAGQVHRAGAAVRGLPRVRRQRADHGRPQGGRACWSAGTATSTPTRTAGAAAPR